jgi:hypothetical protein
MPEGLRDLTIQLIKKDTYKGTSMVVYIEYYKESTKLEK